MFGAFDPSLARAIDSLALPGILVGHRLISPGDELALLEDEADSIPSHAIEGRRASGAARIVGRQLLARLGCAECAFPKGRLGAPIWPAGVTGSFAHDDRVAVAAIGRRCDVDSVGIDVEAAAALPPELLELVATPQEQRRICDDSCHGRLLFAAKEAVYKAVYPLDQTFLEYHEIEVDLADRKAVVRNGRVVDLRFCISTHVVALALI
jgi:4'-phosphopantetheinyl transferase EntD